MHHSVLSSCLLKVIAILIAKRILRVSTLMGQECNQGMRTMPQEVYSIPLWKYNEQSQVWSSERSDQKQSTVRWDKFSVVTYNIWFAKDYQSLRFDGLCDILNKSQAQIIGLQESVYHCFSLLIKIRKNKICTNISLSLSPSLPYLYLCI